MKKLIIKIGFFALKRGSISVSRFNKELKNELKAWPDGFTIQLKVLNNGPSISFMKKKNRLTGISNKKENYDLIVVFKTIDIAFRVITTLSSVPKAFTQNRLAVYGSTADSMILIRILNIVQSYLFPPILSKRILKRVPQFGFKEHLGRIRVYTTGLLFTY